MAPTYADGERIWAVRSRRVRPGDVVVFRAPPAAAEHLSPAARDVPMVKRVAAVGPAGVAVRGDAPRSLDSTVFGNVPADLVIGRGIRRFSRPAPENGAGSR
jgi:type IV secretory pathway protease TraF